MLVYESILYQRGYEFIAGVDEAGRGALAGPVVAAAVVFPKGTIIPGLKESKQLSEARREKFYDEILLQSLATGVGIISNAEIDRSNILQATLKAMMQAVSTLKFKPDYVLIDGNAAPSIPIPHQAIIKGDQKSISIAAASIIAKVTRDRMMCQYHKLYPQYGFDKHKGYGTRQHFAAISQFGTCKIHRQSFRLKKMENEKTGKRDKKS